MTQESFTNYLSNLQDKKSQLISLAQRASDLGWIPAARTQDTSSSISLEEIKEKLEKDTLTIGVIGQMKSGKSTFLNSFIFEDNVLPSATTPMTAALSVITYGIEEKVVAEFYTPDEWKEQKMLAELTIEGTGDTHKESKIKAAKDLVSKAYKLGDQLEQYLGRSKEDKLSNLISYVGAEGDFVSITKCVTIYTPKEYLKGVEIVDTPGFNDPIVSREERTKEFLKRADVVLVMLYAGRPFDATDRDIIFHNVRQCGIGKVLVGINKYDIPYCSESNPEDETQIKEYVMSEIKKASKECGDPILVNILKDIAPIPISAEMALLSKLPMDKIEASDAFKFAWGRHCTNFEISSQSEMLQKSHITDLTDAIVKIIDQEKNEILFRKPLNAIFAGGSNIKQKIDGELTLTNEKIESLRLPDEEKEIKKNNLQKSHKKISKEITKLESDLREYINKLTNKGKKRLEDDVDASCDKLYRIINDWNPFEDSEIITAKIKAEITTLSTRTLKRTVESLAESGKENIIQKIADFSESTENYLHKYLPEFDAKFFVSNIKNHLKIDIENNELFSIDSEEEDDEYGILNFINDFFNGFTFGLLKKATNILSHKDLIAKFSNGITQLRGEFDPDPYLNTAFSRINDIIKSINQTFISEFIEPLQEQIEEILSDSSKREQLLKDEEAKKIELISKKQKIETELEEMSAAKAAIL